MGKSTPNWRTVRQFLGILAYKSRWLMGKAVKPGDFGGWPPKYRFWGQPPEFPHTLQFPVRLIRGKTLDFPLCAIPTVSHSEKSGVFGKHRTSRNGLL